jgi:peptide/nickel transport system permease protein
MKTNILNYIIAFWIIILVNFLLPRLMPGDPLTAIYGEEVLLQMTPTLKNHLTEAFGLSQPLWRQFFLYLLCLFRGDLGYSFYHKISVLRLILGHLPWTLLLIGASFGISTIISIILGIESGWRRGGWLDKSLLIGMMSTSGLPSFFVAILFLLIFSVTLGILPLQGAQTAYAGLSGGALLLDIGKHLILPLSSLVVMFTSGNYLLSRNSIISVIKEPFILTAKAKGLKERKVQYKHAGRNSLLPVVTAVGIRFGSMIITGALFVEIVFSYPGMGTLIYSSLLRRDYPVLQGSLFMVTLVVLMVNLSIDLLYRRLDPRVGHAR